MTPEERAVIDAATEWRGSYVRADVPDMDRKLWDAVEALRSAANALEALQALSVRAYNIMQREHWTAEQLAALDWQTVVDTRNAGPVVWAAWTIALREAGLDAKWIDDLMVYSDFKNVYDGLKEGLA